MNKLFGGCLLVAGLTLLSAPARAQQVTVVGPERARYELGADLSAAFTKPSGDDIGLDMGLPVDIRVGILTDQPLMWEPRLSVAVQTLGTTTYRIVPGVNVLYHLNRETATSGLMRAPYVTGGVALNFFDFGTSWTQLSLDGGVGKRVPFGSSAARFEGFLGYMFEGGGHPSNVTLGTRIGLSFWH